MVWASQDSTDDAVPGVDSVKAKPLKKRCSSRAGLSRYYNSKSQSFSSLDMVQYTPFGNSARALAKRPSSFDLRRASPRSGLGRMAFASLPISNEVCMGMSNEQEVEGNDSVVVRCCPCNDTIFADPADAFISPDGSPSASPLQLYDSCCLSSPAVASFQQQQQAQLTTDYLKQLTALLPFQQGPSCCGGTTGGSRSLCGGAYAAAAAAGCSCGSCCSSSSCDGSLCRGTSTSLSTCDSGLSAGTAGRLSFSWPIGSMQLASSALASTEAVAAGRSAAQSNNRSPSSDRCHRASRNCISAGGHPSWAVGPGAGDVACAATAATTVVPQCAQQNAGIATGPVAAGGMNEQPRVPWPHSQAAGGRGAGQCRRSGLLLRHRPRHPAFGCSSTDSTLGSSTEELIASLSLSDERHHHHHAGMNSHRRRSGVAPPAAERPPLTSQCNGSNNAGGGGRGYSCSCSLQETTVSTLEELQGRQHHQHLHHHQKQLLYKQQQQWRQQQRREAEALQPQLAPSSGQPVQAATDMPRPAALSGATGVASLWCGSGGASGAGVAEHGHRSAAAGLFHEQQGLRHKQAGSEGGWGASQLASCPVPGSVFATTVAAAGPRALSASGAKSRMCGGGGGGGSSGGDSGRWQEGLAQSQLQQPHQQWAYGSAPSRMSVGMLIGAWPC